MQYQVICSKRLIILDKQCYQYELQYAGSIQQEGKHD